MKKVHGYYILEELCRERDFKIKMMAGSRSDYTTFTITQRQLGPPHKKRTPQIVIHGSVFGTVVTLGIGTSMRKAFDLQDPNSISDIENFFNAENSWRVASK